MPDTAKWAAYDVARSRLLNQIAEYDHLIDREQASAVPDPAKIAVLESEQSALIDQSDLLSPEQPHFIEIGDVDDIERPLPTFVTRDLDKSSRQKMAQIFAMAKAESGGGAK